MELHDYQKQAESADKAMAELAATGMMEKYQHARKHAPHPELDAYRQVLASKARDGMTDLAVLGEARGDQVLATGPSPNGGVELIVRKADGVVVLLMPDLPQVRNTPQGPKMVKTQAPLQLPLVRRIAPRHSVMALNRLWGLPVPRALLLFQGRFTTASRELELT